MLKVFNSKFSFTVKTSQTCTNGPHSRETFVGKCGAFELPQQRKTTHSVESPKPFLKVG